MGIMYIPEIESNFLDTLSKVFSISYTAKGETASFQNQNLIFAFQKEIDSVQIITENILHSQ